MTKPEFDKITAAINTAVKDMERRLEVRMDSMATYFIQQHLLDRFKEEVNSLVNAAVRENVMVWVETKPRSMVPAEIRERYAAGERQILVSPKTFADYCDSIMATTQRAANVREDVESGPLTIKERWVAYKDARVILTQV